MSVKHTADIDSANVKAGKKTTRKILIGPEEGPNFAMRRFTISPGGGIPAHTNKVEHEQYVLHGSARVGIGNKIHTVTKDDVVYIPAGVEHWYETLGEENFEFICVVPNKEDEIRIVGG